MKILIESVLQNVETFRRSQVALNYHLVARSDEMVDGWRLAFDAI